MSRGGEARKGSQVFLSLQEKTMADIRRLGGQLRTAPCRRRRGGLAIDVGYSRSLGSCARILRVKNMERTNVAM